MHISSDLGEEDGGGRLFTALCFGRHSRYRLRCWGLKRWASRARLMEPLWQELTSGEWRTEQTPECCRGSELMVYFHRQKSCLWVRMSEMKTLRSNFIPPGRALVFGEARFQIDLWFAKNSEACSTSTGSAEINRRICMCKSEPSVSCPRRHLLRGS